jgi:hypothetical protein
MRNPRISLSGFVALGVVFAGLPCRAQEMSTEQFNFTVAPPPLGYPKFADDLSNWSDLAFDNSVGGAVAWVSGPRLSLVGAGVGWIPRLALGRVAFNPGIAFFLVSGAVTPRVEGWEPGFGERPDFDFSMKFWMVDISPAAEVIVFRNQYLGAVLYAGVEVMLAWSHFIIENFVVPIPPSPPVVDLGVDTMTTLYGPFGGLQAQITVIDDFVFTPYFQLKYISGNVNLDDYTFETRFLHGDHELQGVMSYTAGLDVIYQPLGVSLSSLLQLAPASDDDSRFTSTTVNLKYSF